MRRLRCLCGGEVPEPIPSHCPHCGKRIARVRRYGNWFGPMLVGLLFAGLVALLLWLASSF